MAVCLALLAAWGVSALIDARKARERRLQYEEVFRPLRQPHYSEKEGFWVGDITENYRLGKISRQLAEADTAPLNPLVPKPIPFHGYYVRVLDSGEAMMADQPPVSFKGMKRSRDNYAILIYPAEPGPGKYTIIHNPLGVYRRSDAWSPTFEFPTGNWRHVWSIVD